MGFRSGLPLYLLKPTMFKFQDNKMEKIRF